jgi:phosphatidylserine/phosphatidylglycerophosphate/cardiolipin synthase-like enzyme/uncharacterized membrane protein YdjX (TVP38/TMEM64 family)
MQQPALLVEGETCWRRTTARRAAVLIDGAAYFAALRAAILAAERSLFIVGWDIDSRVRVSGDGEVAAPRTLRELLSHAVSIRPDLSVHLLLWDYSVLYALEREPLPSLNLGWTTPPQILVQLDGNVPLGGSHHQKIVVVDDTLAFCGGLDLTIRRWDTPEHHPRHPQRVDPQGKPYAPFHDLQLAVDGDAAVALAELVRERWHAATGRAALTLESRSDMWIEGQRPDFTNVEIGIARTLPPTENASAIREVEALYCRSIEQAQRHIYIENQYLTADRISEALARRLEQRPELEVVIVGPKEPGGWLEASTMGTGRRRFRHHLERSGALDRVRLLYPFVRDGDLEIPVMVHSKLMVVDDQLLRIGSSNLNNRSMGLDTECDLALIARDDHQRAGVARIRNRLLAEHLGVALEQVDAAMAEHGSLLRVVDELGSAERRLATLGDVAIDDDEFIVMLREIADSERPLEPEAFVGDMFGAAPARKARKRLALVAGIGVLLLGLLLAWQVTPLQQLLDPELLAGWLDEIATHPWAPLALLAVYLVGGLVMFPVTVLIVLTAMTFGPWLGTLYATVGALASAALTYQLGALAGKGFIRGLMGPRLDRISRGLAKRGIISMATVRVVPIAPYTVVNMVAGASHIRFGDYLIGTLFGMFPGIVVMTALGDRLRQLWHNPTPASLALVAVVLALWIGLSLALQRVVACRRK